MMLISANTTKHVKVLYRNRSVEVDIPVLTKPKVQAFLPERESRYKVSNLLCTQELLRFNRRPEFALSVIEQHSSSIIQQS